MNPQLDRLTALPTLPTVAVQILKVFSDPDSAVLDVVALIQTDPALSAKVLNAANSARFSTGRSISSLQRAVLLLGKKVVCSLALGFSLAEASMSGGKHAKLFRQYWLQSFARALAAQMVAIRYGVCLPEDAFTVGLLSIVGRLALLKNEPDEFLNRLEEAESRGVSLERVEHERLSVSSVELTASMFERWNLSEQFTTAVRAQAIPESESSPATNRLTRVLQIAGAVGEFVASQHRALPLARLYELLSDWAKSDSIGEEVDQLITQVRNQLGEHSSLFNIELSRIGSPADLLSEAVQQLTELNLALSQGDQGGDAPYELVRENSRLRKRINELTRDSTTDALTGVYNRRYFVIRLQEAIERAQTRNLPVAVLLGDIDYFKQVNDMHGHLAGDEVLREVATCLRQVMRGADIVARYGGEEFAILVDTTDRNILEILGERVRAQIELTTSSPSKSNVAVTISVGGAIEYPKGDPDEFMQQLLIKADQALYEAKTAGRNRVVIANSTAEPLPSDTTVA